jgi:hypothetical protein
MVMHKRSAASLVWQTFAGVALGVMLAVLFVTEELSSDRERVEIQRQPTQPLRVELATPDAFRELQLALRIHHYRAQPLNSRHYLDTFYDTDDWRLTQLGYSYRFRQGKQVDGESAYLVRLEREPRFSRQAEKLDLVSEVPADLGGAIAKGDWQLAVSSPVPLESLDKLRGLLAELGIEPSQLRPRLVGELVRERFDVADKGQNWFELDWETWTYHRHGEPKGDAIRIVDAVIDTRLSPDHPELSRRVTSLRRILAIIDGLHPVDTAPHERAIQSLTAQK